MAVCNRSVWSRWGMNGHSWTQTRACFRFETSRNNCTRECQKRFSLDLYVMTPAVRVFWFSTDCTVWGQWKIKGDVINQALEDKTIECAVFYFFTKWPFIYLIYFCQHLRAIPCVLLLYGIEVPYMDADGPYNSYAVFNVCIANKAFHSGSWHVKGWMHARVKSAQW